MSPRGSGRNGPKNRLRSQDIHKIVDVFTRQHEIDRYSRLVPLAEIADPKNDYNVNIPRYIDSSEPEDLQDLHAHLPSTAVDADRLENVHMRLCRPRRRSSAGGATGSSPGRNRRLC